jgi:hypothetical protein
VRKAKIAEGVAADRFCCGKSGFALAAVAFATNELFFCVERPSVWLHPYLLEIILFGTTRTVWLTQ